ncbi:hypothetical protein AGABI2DRAFT_195836 [Agaricus bisporus var. bisporus H97]|uniref:hypothetical protein n=1 Tax=Agaricus bisporus var. bisporus (strain H97 / ATCC MYA-4626 / FGSC 10389) TaxID=936046 RepID=UPI00029F7D0B|nr:hypothetical protein AGABI2DRAFT_195836 [Agaricus bisporus var. bisporus H97]EKV42532.1 hypothetical protein AGABI2DRAFT_195836 [Agaricus bisporus var. bisporus H97]
MALNCVMLSQQHAPIPLPGPSAGSEETEVARVPLSAAVELLLEIPVVPPSGNGTAGGSGGAKKLQSTGWIWLSDQRFVFIKDPAKNSQLNTLSVPLHSILQTKYEQPIFGGNYLVIDIKPTSGGGLTEGTKLEVRFKNEAIFPFIVLLQKTREKAIYMRRQIADEEVYENLPTYTTPAESMSTASMRGCPSDNPPEYEN